MFIPSIQYGVFGGGRRLQNYPPNADEGYLKLHAPPGFMFSMTNIEDGLDPIFGSSTCSRSLLEVNGRDLGDAKAVYNQGTDIDCAVEGGNTTLIRFIGERPLLAGVTYRYRFYVNNPVFPVPIQSWYFFSYKKKIDVAAKEYGQIVPLDMFTFQGYHVYPTFDKFMVDNLSQESNGGFKVRRVKITMQLSQPVMDGDMLRVAAPVGFTITEKNNLGMIVCAGFRYPGSLLPLLNTPEPSCICEDAAKACDLVFKMQEGARDKVALLKATPLTFEISGVNPTSNPDAVVNTWSAYHQRGSAALASTTVPSWLVFSQPQNITIDISGMFKRAGAETEVTLTFVCTAWASALELIFTEPVGFDFSACLVSAPLERDERSGAGKLVVVGGDFKVGVRSWVVAKKVRLGQRGGNTRINFRLFSDKFLMKPVGRRYNFTNGFRLPGSLAVRDQQLLSQAVVMHYENNILDAVQPLLPARAGLLTRVEVTFALTMNVGIGHKLNFLSVAQTGETPYYLYYEPGFFPTLDHCEYGPLSKAVSPHTSCKPIKSINITDVDLTRGGTQGRDITVFSMRLTHAAKITPQGLIFPNPILPVLEQGQIYRLRAWCLPNTFSVKWRLETDDGGLLPTNTNDGITQAIGTVAPMDLDLTAIRTPPSSVIMPSLSIFPGPFGTAVEQVRILLPLGFTGEANDAGYDTGSGDGVYKEGKLTEFGNTCKVPCSVCPLPCGVCRVQCPVCRYPNGNDAKCTGRKVSRMMMLPSQRRSVSALGATLSPRVMSPPSNGVDPRFFVVMYKWPADALIKTDANAQMVAWGSFPGWILDPLNVTITYANIEFFLGNVAVFFVVPKLSSGKYAVIRAPKGFILGCPKPLPGKDGIPCTIAVQEVKLTLTGRGREEGASRVYSFVVPMKTPELPPKINNWDVRIYDGTDNIVDGIVGIKKDTFVQGMFISNPFIEWGGVPQRGEVSNVIVTVTLVRRIWALRAILISMPEGYKHDIQHPNQFKTLTKTFPSAIDTEWRNYNNLRWVRILIAVSSSTVDFVPSGTYRFQFPVMLPIYKPLATEWYLSLCKDYKCQSVNPKDAGIIVTFPMPNPTNLLPSRKFIPTAKVSGTTRISSPLVSFVILEVVFLLASTWQIEFPR